MDTHIQIKAANRIHFPALRGIELASFATLRAAGAVAGEPVASSDEALDRYARHNLLLAAFTPQDVPVGFGGGCMVEDALHICEVDVHPSWQKRGIGGRLMTALLDEGRARGLRSAVLTTDRHAPFNAPFYTSLGFRILGEREHSAWLAALLRAEEAQGLDPRRRVAMQAVL